MLSPASQLLMRNESLFEQGRWGLVNPQDSRIFQELSAYDVYGLHQYYDQYQAACAATNEQQHTFAATFDTQDKYDGLIVYIPKAKQHARMLLANLAPLLKIDGQLLVVGENKAGVKSAGKLLAEYGEHVNKIDAARHCSLFCTHVTESAPVFTLDKWFKPMSFEVAGTKLTLDSLPGVFSHGELDQGTRLLLEYSPSSEGKQVLDFACGAGVIGLYLAQKFGLKALTMSDVNALALCCAERNASRMGVEAKAVPSNGLGDISEKFDAVYTNPPFHTGVSTDYQITEDFIQQVGKHLFNSGQLTLVANRFLKYPDVLQSAFGGFNILGQTGKFTLYHTSK